MSTTFSFKVRAVSRKASSSSSRPGSKPSGSKPTGSISQGANLGNKVNNIVENVQNIVDNLENIVDNLRRIERLNNLNGQIIHLYTKVLNLNIDNTTFVQVLTTSNMTPYFYPTGYAIPEDVIKHGIHPLVTTNHMVPMDDNLQYIGAPMRRYHQLHTSKVYTKSLVIPHLSSGLAVRFTDPVSKTEDTSFGWRFSAANNVMAFVAGSSAGQIVAKDVRCTNLYVNPPLSSTASATVQVNGSISCQSLTVGGSNIGQVASVSTAHLMAAMSYLQASTVFKAILTKSTSSSQLNFKVRATLDDGLFNNGNANGLMAHIFVRGIRFKIVVTSANVDSETTYLSRIQDMAESLTSGIQFYYSDVASGAAPHGTNLYITISPTIYASVNAVGIRHEIGPNRTAYRTNPTGTRIEVACPPLRVVTPSSWSEIRL